jgi:hypothetical protein
MQWFRALIGVTSPAFSKMTRKLTLEFVHSVLSVSTAAETPAATLHQ